MTDAEKLKQLEDRRWKAADQLRTNSSLAALKALPEGTDIGQALNRAMEAIEELQKLARSLDDEAERHVREELREEELLPSSTSSPNLIPP